MKNKIFTAVVLILLIIFSACGSSGGDGTGETKKEGLEKIKESVRKKHKDDIEDLDAEIQRLKTEIKSLKREIEKEKRDSNT